MAENKKSFVLYADLLHTVQKLPDDKAGVLLKTILEYVNDLNPEVDDILVDLVFEPIKHQLKRDLKRYENFKIKQSENGKLGGRPKKEENPKKPSLSEKNHETQKSLNVNVNDNVINNIEEEEEGENFKIIVNLQTVTDLKKFIKEKFARSEEDLKMKLTTAKYLERQEVFILRNNERSYTSDNDFLNHYRNFILKNPQPEKEKSSGQKEKVSRTEQILNTHEQYLSTLQA